MDKFKKSYIIAKKIVDYFDGELIGSVLLRDFGLSSELINDIDVAIHPDVLFKVIRFLDDCGYEEVERNSRQEKGYADFIGSLVFKPMSCEIPIHLSLKEKNFKLMTVKEIIGEKFLRGLDNDIKQLKQMLEAK